MFLREFLRLRLLSTFDQTKAEDSARAQSPSMEHETNYFESKFDFVKKKIAAELGTPVEFLRAFQSRDTQNVFETRTSTFEDSVRA